MKLNKKYVVVGGIMLCWMMVVPMTVDASSSKCPPHAFNKNNEYHSEEIKNHSYIYGMRTKEEAVEEYFYKDCTMTITIDQYELDCANCEINLKQQGLGERRTHECDF